MRNRKTRGLLITFVMAAAVLAYLGLIFIPAQRSIGELRRELDEQRRFVLGVDARYSDLTEVERELHETREFVRVESEGRSRTNLIQLLPALTDFAATDGLTLQRVAPGDPKDGKTMRQYTIELRACGTFSSLFSFIRRIEGYQGCVWITAVEFEPNSQDGELLACKLCLTAFADLPSNSD